MSINPAHDPGDFTPKKNIPEGNQPDYGSFSRPEKIPATSSTQTRKRNV